MTSGDKTVVGAAFFGLSVGILLMRVWVDYLGLNHSDKQIIAHGCAYYAPDTGRFTWGQP